MRKKEYIRNTYGDKETTTSAAQAMSWHREGDAVTVTRAGNILAVIAGAARPERDAAKENRETCRRIAEEVEAYADGLMHRCPDCANQIQLPENVGDKYRCPYCGQVHDVDDLEQLSIWDYMEDILDISFHVSRDRNYKSCKILVAFGGPNIYIDTASAMVKMYWWTEYAEYPLSYSARDSIDEWAEEYWNL